MNPGTSRNSSFVSVEEHAEFTTAALTRRDAPHRPISDDDDIVSIHDDQQSRRGGEKEDKRLAQEKLFDQLWKEKYSQECPELWEYRKTHITLEQMESINLDDHSAYLTLIRQDISQYPHRNVMSCHRLLKQLEDHDLDAKADRVRMVIEKGLNSYAPARKLPANTPVIEPKYFIRVIQKKNGEIIDR